MQDDFAQTVAEFVREHVFATPERATEVHSWQSHIPFGMWLVGAARPRVLVELGTHKGDSYAGFCQAVKALGLPTRCFAIDTWRGDDHAGAYDDAIFNEVEAVNTAQYAAFSTLLRMTFDEALSQVADGSVDLLHIDGLHTYDAVRHDFESWLPKLSDRAIVLFHDTQVREGDFGVWRFWDEVTRRHPGREFSHGHGLGVLAVGANIPAEAAWLFETPAGPWRHVDHFFARVGAACAGRGKELALNAALGRERGEVAHLTAVVAQVQAAGQREQEHLVSVVRGLQADHARAMEEKRRRLDERATEAEALQREAARLEALADKAHAEIERLERLYERDMAEQTRRFDDIVGSPSWRLTRPMRVGLRVLGRARKRLTSKAAPPPEVVAVAPPPPRSAPAPRPLSLPCPERPDVSIIISTYGAPAITLDCLRSIMETAPRCAIEVIVVDDAFPDRTEMADIAAVEGVRFIRNETNLGFLRSCNRAARQARGRYLHMLNNDTLVLPNAIDALAALLDARPDIGIAGSKLIFPDHRLQEAGGVIWRNASGWNYGRGDDPNLPSYTYPREVDYCSGASLMIARSLWESLGGFDEHFAPAYYEDVDLAFRVRQAGLKVVYEPRSVIIHLEGMSHGTDTGSGVKAHQLVNQQRFRERWGEKLDSGHFEGADDLFRARDAGRRKVALVVDHYVPEPDRDAGSRSVVGIMTGLLDAGWTVKLWPHNRQHDPFYVAPIERLGIEVLDGRLEETFDDWMKANGGHLDHVMVIRPEIAADVIPQLMRRTRAPTSFYGVDLHCARMRMQAAQQSAPSLLVEADAMERLERMVWRNFDMVIYPSDEEAATVRAMAPEVAARGIVPFHFDAFPPRERAPEARNILFVAGFAHPPNVDAAHFLVEDILPRVEARIGPVSVTLAGSNPTESVRHLHGGKVTVTGYISDARLAELYDEHRVAVVPLRFGAGVKGKVIEGLSRGLPLVTTPVGAQGIAGLDAVVAVATDADALAEALALLLTDDAAWLERSRTQMVFAQTHYSRAAMGRSVLAVVEEAAAIAARTRPVPDGWG